jgi:signal peptidase
LDKIYFFSLFLERRKGKKDVFMDKTQAKKIGAIVANVLVWAFLVFAALVTVLTFVSLNAKDGVPSIFGKSFVSVQSPSMDGDKEGSFKQGDMLIVTKITANEALELTEGTIITYRAPIDINGDGETGDINTHRIVSKRTTDGGIVFYKTQGDAEAHEDNYELSFTDVVAVYDGHSKLSGIGAVADFLKSSLGFFLIVVLPMALFFLYEVYNLIKLIMEQKMKKVSASVSQETEEEIKRRAIEEFLAQQAQAQASATATEEVTTEEVTTEEVAEPTSSDEE